MGHATKKWNERCIHSTVGMETGKGVTHARVVGASLLLTSCLATEAATWKFMSCHTQRAQDPGIQASSIQDTGVRS